MDMLTLLALKEEYEHELVVAEAKVTVITDIIFRYRTEEVTLPTEQKEESSEEEIEEISNY